MFSEPTITNPFLDGYFPSSAGGSGLFPDSSPRIERPSPRIVTGEEAEVPASDLYPHASKQIPIPYGADSSAKHSYSSTTFPPDYHVMAKSSSFSLGDSVAVSPAAMFLSSFSSSPTPAVLPDAEGQVVAGYTLGATIGFGAFSTVRRASSTTGGIVAVKIIRHSDLLKQNKPAAARKRLDHETAIWASLSHEHILPLFSTAHTSYAEFFFTLFCPAGSLFDILKRDGRPALPQDDAGMMFRQVVRGLRYLHEAMGLVHRDIKLENVLVDEMGVCRIGDFGMTKKIGELDEGDEDADEDQQDEARQQGTMLHRAASMAQSRYKASAGQPAIHFPSIRHNGVRHRNSTPISGSSTPARPTHAYQPGSLPYASPELLLPQSTEPICPHPAQDIWALGVMLYALLTGKLPFTDSFEPRLQMKILHGVYEVPEGIGRGAEKVLSGCLERCVPNRWTIAMVDDVAWGVGWGAAGDDALSPVHDEEEDVPELQRKPSTPRTAHNDTADLDREPEDILSTPALDAAQRRSSSRAQRSRSRAPVLSDRPSVGRNGRSSSRVPQSMSPTFSSLNDAIMRTLSSSSSSSSTSSSALIISPTPSLERGRRLKKAHVHSTSRSPSPVPATPVDLVSKTPLPSLQADNDDSSSRGRRTFGRGVRTPRAEPSLYGDASELDTLDEAARWTSALKTDKSGAHASPGVEETELERSWDDIRVARRRSPSAAERALRAGSVPPASHRFAIPYGGTPSVDTARAATGPARSRSVGCRPGRGAAPGSGWLSRR